ncbi:hypothetical protein THRCLA_03316 [Thraustotheca clavata]|uniref:PPM-type phosphatase domain-containing protein n=1 Tax=Thraustotheca clavata TaxID=74557 RepID=A0A1W0A2P6_9STRA|nr:hypothetical protein THRCLA_03316 [Thraustotheca clavata]
MTASFGKEILLSNPHISFIAITHPFASFLKRTPPLLPKKTPLKFKRTDLTHGFRSWKSPSHSNEDRALIYRGIRYSLFAVMDGHGGDMASEFVKANLVSVLDEQAELNKDTIAMAIAILEKRFIHLAKELRNYSGACFVALLILQDGSHKRFVINLGDCRLCALEIKPHGHPRRQFKALSKDHKASCPEERRRILLAGGSVVSGRVAGVLAPSRSIGDIDMKVPAMDGWVIAEPEITEGIMEPGSIYVLATDGVWDVMTNEEVLDMAEDELEDDEDDGKSCERACEAIGKEAIARGSRDDITAIVVHTNDW